MPKTYDNRISGPGLYAAVLFPPLIYWSLVALFGSVQTEGRETLFWFYGLLALAHGLPLAALAWTLCSVCAFTVSGDALVVHRVVSDRAWPLSEVGAVTSRGEDVAEVTLGGKRKIFRPANREDFIATLEEARHPSPV